MAIILPDTLAKGLILAAVEFSNTSIISSYKSESFCQGQIISTVLNLNEIQAIPTVGLETIHIYLYLVPNLTK